MKRVLYITMIIGLTAATLAPLTARALEGGKISAEECLTGTHIDNSDAPDSIRAFEKYFNQQLEQDRGCTKKITIQSDIDLLRGLVFLGPSSNTLTIDGGGFTIKAHQVPEKDVCVITIIGAANGVKIQNLKIVGNGTTVLDGICLYTNNNEVRNVKVSYMGRRGIVVDGLNNAIGGLENTATGERQSSVIAYNKSPGIFVTKDYLSSSNKVDADTVLFQNAESTVTASAPTPAALTPEQQALQALAQGEGSHPFPAPPVVGLPNYEPGQQIYVVNDQTSYLFRYKLKPGGEVTATNSFIKVQSTDAAAIKSSTVLLIMNAKPESGVLDVDNLSLSKTLIGVVTQLTGKELDNKFEVPKGQPQLSSKILGSMNKLGKMSDMKFTASQIYLLVYPEEQSVASATGKISLSSTGGFVQYCFVANKLDPACQEAGKGGLGGSGGGVFGDGGDFFDDNGNFSGGGEDSDGDGTPDTPAFANHLEVSQLIEDAAKKACVNFQFGGQTAYDTDDDLDGDGIASAIEDSDTPDCEPQGNETVPYLYDTDHDGLGDGEEDANHNGYVDCKIVSVDANGKPNLGEVGTELVPTFRGTKADPNDATKTVECEDNDVDCNTLTDEVFLGKRVPVPSSLGLNIGYGNWKGVPRFVKVLGEKSDQLTLTNKFIVCSETDPREIDSDGDGLTDGEESRKRFVDFSTPAYVYDVKTKSLKKDLVSKQPNIKCDSLLAGSTAFKALRAFVAYDYSEQLRRIEWADCRVGNPKAEGELTDFSGALDPEWGETEPRLPDTDLDGKLDPNDECPNNPLQVCEFECARGWKSWQVGHVAGLKLGSELDEAGRAKKYQETLVELSTLAHRVDTAAKGELESKLSVIPSPMTNGQSDDDNIPDLVEAGLPEIGTSLSDCPDNSVQFLNRTSPFKKWTDQELVSKDTDGDKIKDTLDATKVNDKIVYDDHNDPCPGSSIKIGGKTLAKDLGCMTEKPSYIGKMPLAACYYDRDNDGLFDCLEDKNVNGLWDKKDGETSPLKFSSSNSGLSDQATANVVDENGNPLNALTDDTDGDGLPDAVEISKGGTADFYDPVKNVGLCNPDVVDGGADPKGSQFWTAVAANSPLQAKGFEYQFTFDTDPFNKDTDGDGIDDGDEMKFGYSPANADSDGDGVCDGPKDVAEAKCVSGEDQNGDGKFPFFSPGDPTTLSFGNPGESNPCDPNTDHHGKFDDQDTCKNVPDENCISPNAMGTDSDSDGIPDLTEIQFTNTDPFDKDTDKDGLLDGALIDPATKQVKPGSGELTNQLQFGQFFSSFDQLNSPDCGKAPYTGCDTNPTVVDTDGDGMNDKQERTYPTNPIVKDTDGDCIADGLEDTHFTKQADGSYAIIPGSIDGTFAGCNDVPAGDAGIGKICTETHADNWDTDGDQLADGNIGNVGEDLDCNGVQNLEVGTLLPLETSPKTWDTDADGESDYAEMTRFGGFNISQNLSRATSGQSRGCSLASNDHTATTRSADMVMLLLLVGLPLAVLTRTRRQA